MGSGLCDNDGAFGPGANCRELDFTLLFEYVFLVFTPALILIFLSTWRLNRLYSKKRAIKAWSHLPLGGKATLMGKVVVAVLGVAAQAWWLGVTAGDVERKGWWSAWLALGMGLVASISLLSTVTLEHLRSHRPSQVPALYTLVSSLLLSSVLRTESLISSSSHFIPPISLVLGTHIALFILLQISARSSLVNTSVPPGATSGLVSRYLIAWVVPLLWRGFRKPLKMRDLGEIDTSLHTSETWRAFEPEWERYRVRARISVQDAASTGTETVAGAAGTEPDMPGHIQAKTTGQPLLRALFAAFTGKLCAPLLPALIACVSSLARPLLISRTILFVQSYTNSSPSSSTTPQPLSEGWGLVGAAALTYLTYSLSYLLEHLAIQRSALALRGALMEALFRKSLKIRVETAIEMGAAKASNLMSTDVDNVVRQVQAVHDVWTALVLTGLGLYIIWTQIGLSFSAAVVGAIIFFALLPPLTRYVGGTRLAWAEAVDRRIKFTSSVLRHIKAIKLSAYEPRILAIANGMRNDEMNAFTGWVKQILKVSILTNWLSHGLALMTVTTFTLVTLFKGGDGDAGAAGGGGAGGVTTARIFTVISTIELISMPLLDLGQKMGALLTAWASLKRIEGFLLDSEKSDDASGIEDRIVTGGEALGQGGGLREGSARVELDNVTFGVQGKIELLKGLSVKLDEPGLWMITGRVGCGKSSLLQALIGELDLLPSHDPPPTSESSATIDGTAYSRSLSHTGTGTATGKVHINLGTIGYCSQDPWLRATGTVRDNITFDKPYETAWYKAVLEATALAVDVGAFEEGDRRVVSGLSGGQKQRVALARAIYGQFDTLILDDPFSALDATTEAQVFASLFSPTSGLLHGKTVIVATNQIHRLMSANYVTILEHGRIAEQGTYADLNSKKDGMLRMLVEEFAAGAAEREAKRAEEAADAAALASAAGGPSGYKGGGSSQELSIIDALGEPAGGGTDAGSTSARSGANDSNRIIGAGSITSTLSDPASTTSDEHNTTGSVPFAVYLLYLRGLGYVSACFWVTIVVTNAIIQLCVNIYLQAWTGILGHTPIGDRGKYGQFLGGYAGMTLGYLVTFALGIYHAYVNSHPVASRRMHDWMMTSVLGTSLSFFERTPIGQVVNRFNSDLNMLDMILPNHAVNFMHFGTTVVGSAAIIIVADPVMAAVVAGTAIAMVLLQRFYVRAGRELRRLDMTTRSPIYTLFSETIDPDGLRTIRAMKAEKRSIGLMTRRATESQYPAWLLLAVQKWLELALNLACSGINILLVLVAVLNRRSASAGILAVAMTQAAQLNTNLMALVVEWTNVEMCITSVERIKEYINLPPQADDGADDETSGDHYLPPPAAEDDEDDAGKGKAVSKYSMSISTKKNKIKAKGSIVFRNVIARYGPNLPPALKGLNIAIKPGQRVGICGRTGSGKSTLLAVLWRLIEYDTEEGEVLVDGKEITERGLASLRSSMSIIPQDPLLLDLTVRENIDIEGLHSDTDIWNALEQAQLKPHIAALPLGLSAPITDTSLSRGQRQLLALARAILRSRPILALDEATSSIDSTTDALIQQTIREAFEGKTVLTIAHRIGTIVDYDVVVVMQDGQVVEIGEPGMLIETKGRFWELARESGVVSG